MNEQRLLEIDTILWCGSKKKSERYKQKVARDLIEFGKMSALCK